VVDHDDRGSRVNKPVEHAHQHRDAQRVQALVGSSKTCSAPRWLLRGLRVFNARGPGYARDAPREPAPGDARAIAIGVRTALARVQARHPAWTRADLMRQVKISVPAERFGLDPHAAVALVKRADRPRACG